VSASHIEESIPVLRQRIEALEAYVAELVETNRLLKAAPFGRSSERRLPPERVPGQPTLPFEDEPPRQPPAPVPEKIQIGEHHRRKRGRKALPPDLPRVTEIIDLPDDQKKAACGCPLKCMGEVVTEKLAITKPKAFVKRTIRLKYAPACTCPTAIGAPGEVKIAPAPPQIVPKGIATPELVAHVVTAKFVDAIPLHRQEQQFRRMGLTIGRATMANWILISASACHRLLELLVEEILGGPLISMDETWVQVLGEPGRSNTTKSYMWVCRGGPPDRPGVIFRYEPSRSGLIPEEFLSGYRGYLQTDGYIGYKAIGDRDGISHLGCWAHVRRKFVEVIKGTKGVGKAGIAQGIIDQIGRLYDVERRARQEGLDWGQIVALRERESRPILNEIKAELDKRNATTPPRSLLGKAIGYALNQWPRLMVYLQKGYLRPDNNLTENAIRPFAVGRKNWMFSGSPRGAEASALMFSLIETAKANGIEPDAYLRFLFTEVPKTSSDERLRALQPQHLDRNRLPA
jgi:transposase